MAAAALAGCFGCSSGPRTAADFHGFSRRSSVGPESIGSVGELPVDYESLGSVTAHCTRVYGQRRMNDEWLSDVACSAELLRKALRVRAAEVGGTLLVGERCSARSHAASGSDGPRIRCGARVAAPRGAGLRYESAAARSGSILPDSDEGPSVEEAWNTTIGYTPVRRGPPRPQRRVDLVAELPNQPLDHIVLGDVVARCERVCSLDGVREAVRLTAASVGADAAVDVRCVQAGLGWLCSGRATACEHAPMESGRSP